jgi:hypothetical protein
VSWESPRVTALQNEYMAFYTRFLQGQGDSDEQVRCAVEASSSCRGPLQPQDDDSHIAVVKYCINEVCPFINTHQHSNF